MTTLLEARSVDAGYGAASTVVRDLDLTVSSGEIIALFGSNGAGKTTSLLTLAGELPLLGGEVHCDGAPTTAPLYRRARAGLGLVTEERAVLMQLTVAENLKVSRCDYDLALEYFPELSEHMDRRVSLLSGGQHQMLALARALARPGCRLLLVDELSMGLAPIIVKRLLNALRAAADKGLGVLLVEQHIHLAVSVTDRAYVMRRGRIALEGTTSELLGRLDEVQASYLFAAEASHDPAVTSGDGVRKPTDRGEVNQ